MASKKKRSELEEDGTSIFLQADSRVRFILVFLACFCLVVLAWAIFDATLAALERGEKSVERRTSEFQESLQELRRDIRRPGGS